MTYQIKGLGKLVNVVALEIRISRLRIRKIRKTENPKKKKNDVTPQIKALDKLVHVDTLIFPSSRKTTLLSPEGRPPASLLKYP